jgi:hypothetical protein
MSTVTPPAAVPAEHPALSKRYLEMLRDYDGRAIRSKLWMLVLWNASMLLTWVPPLMAIPALPRGAWLSEGYYHLLVAVILPYAGLANALLAAGQVVLLFRSRWLKYRAATERLRERCMCFRACLAPFSREDAAQHFENALEELAKGVNDRQPFRLWDHIPWSYFVGLQPLPQKLRDPIGHAADERLYPRCENPADAQRIIILERLRNQQRWHLLKARRFSIIYLLFQVGIVLLGLASICYRMLCWLTGAERDLVLLSLFATGTLCLIAYRERLGYAALCVRYTRIVDTLEKLEHSYEALKGAEGANTAQQLEWLRKTATNVERSLASEFQYWYFGRENFGGATIY